MKCKKCDDEEVKLGLCKQHYHHRNTVYKYTGHKQDQVDVEKNRKCLKCDKIFLSTGNRKCDYCNSQSDKDSSLSLFLRC